NAFQGKGTATKHQRKGFLFMANQAKTACGLHPTKEIKGDDHSDTSPEQAGQGVMIAPFVEQALGREVLQFWEMSPAEQTALLFLLQQLRPKVAIEIGTRFGGSLQALSRFCDKVYSLDIDPNVPKRLKGRFTNVEYIIG